MRSRLKWLALAIAVVVIAVAVTVIFGKSNTPKMQEGNLLESKMFYRDGEKLYVEKVGFKDWHAGIHSYYLISDRLAEGQTIVEQRWSYDDFCNVTIRLEDYTYILIRQVNVVALVRSFRSIPIDEFDRMAMPLIM